MARDRSRAGSHKTEAILGGVKVYTRAGDGGETGLFGGQRVRKDSARVAAYGEVDELNAAVGSARAELEEQDLSGWLLTIQSSLFDLGGELAIPDVEALEGKGKGLPRVAEAEVEQLERWIDQMETELTPLRQFILPGGTRAAATLHLARTVCRRAERQVIALAAREAVAPLLIRYLNRLSDLLFVMARTANHRAGEGETAWSGRER